MKIIITILLISVLMVAISGAQQLYLLEKSGCVLSIFDPTTGTQTPYTTIDSLSDRTYYNIIFINESLAILEGGVEWNNYVIDVIDMDSQSVSSSNQSDTGGMFYDSAQLVDEAFVVIQTFSNQFISYRPYPNWQQSSDVKSMIPSVQTNPWVETPPYFINAYVDDYIVVLADYSSSNDNSNVEQVVIQSDKNEKIDNQDGSTPLPCDYTNGGCSYLFVLDFHGNVRKSVLLSYMINSEFGVSYFLYHQQGSPKLIYAGSYNNNYFIFSVNLNNGEYTILSDKYNAPAYLYLANAYYDTVNNLAVFLSQGEGKYSVISTFNFSTFKYITSYNLQSNITMAFYG